MKERRKETNKTKPVLQTTYTSNPVKPNFADDR